MTTYDIDATVSALRKIFSQYGTEILRNRDQLHNVLADLLADMTLERNVLSQAIKQAGIGNAFFEATSAPVSERDRVITLAEHILVHNFGQSQEAAHFSVQVIALSLGWRCTEPRIIQSSDAAQATMNKVEPDTSGNTVNAPSNTDRGPVFTVEPTPIVMASTPTAPAGPKSELQTLIFVKKKSATGTRDRWEQINSPK